MNYKQAIQYLFNQRPVKEPVPLHFKVDYPTVHITGTNGKGSVSLKIAKALERSGLKVGLFTSPHLISFCERIVINSQMIPEEAVHQRLLRLFNTTQNLSFFEIATLLAFEYFRDEKVDIAVIEAGIGGLMDSTNIIEPLVSVITSISLDHEDMLGQGLDNIIFHKAGIIKPRIPVVVGPHADFPAVREKAQTCQSPLYPVQRLPGFYDLENTAIAAQTLEVLKKHFPFLNTSGLQCRPPCRFEQIGRVIFDVAHNPAGFVRLLEAFDFHFPGKKFTAVIGMSKDKDVKKCLSILAERAEHLYLVQSPAVKGMSIDEMASILRQMGFTHLTAGLSIQESLESALSLEHMSIVCGSFYIMKEAREQVIGIEVSSHPPLLFGR